MEETKKSSVATKKILAEKTKAYMKLSPEEAASAFGPLLREYQLEVEGLSKRCRFAEGAFAQVHSGLSKMPPAVPDNSSELETLKSELADLERELTKMRNQDITVRRLETRVKELEAQKKADMSSMENEVARRIEEAEAQFNIKSQQQKSELERAIVRGNQLESEVTRLSNTLSADRQKYDQTVLSKQEEITSLTQQIETLQVKVTSVSSSGEGTLSLYKDLVDKGEIRVKFLEKELETVKAQTANANQKLVEQVRVLTESLNQSDAQLQEQSAHVAAIESLLTKYKAEGPNIEEQLHAVLKEHESKLATLSKLEQSMKGEISKLKQEISSKDSEIQTLKNDASSSGVVLPVAASNSTDDVVAIIQAQRDRLRQRVLDLESERDSLKQTQFELNNRINVLAGETRKIENEKNFWKAQSVENKGKSPGDVELGSFSSNGPPSLSSVRKRTTNDMEQTVTSILVWGLANPVTRRAGLVYLLTLHLLVFFVLYRLSSILSSSSQ
jgi:chromosome segregation ATPase